MSQWSPFKYACLAYLSQPASDRQIYRAIRRHRVRSIVELGVGSGRRTQRMLRLAQAVSPGETIRYAGIDMFEARPADQPQIKLRVAYMEFKRLVPCVQLVPGDPYAALARTANCAHRDGPAGDRGGSGAGGPGARLVAGSEDAPCRVVGLPPRAGRRVARWPFRATGAAGRAAVGRRRCSAAREPPRDAMSLEELLHAKQQQIDQLHRLQSGRSALLVMDMQRGFLEPGAALEVPPGREIIPNLRQLIAACRAAQLPVVFTEFVYSTAVPCLRGDPFGPEHLPAVPGQADGVRPPVEQLPDRPGRRAGAELGRDDPGTGAAAR